MHSFTAIVATVLTAIVAVEAGSQHVPMGNYARHVAAVRRKPAPVVAPIEAPNWSRSRRSLSRRCKPKGSNTPKPAPPSAPPSTPSTPAPNTGSGNGGGSGSGNGNGGSSGGSGSGGNGGGSGPSGGMINFSWGGCPVDPSSSPSNDGGPNGAEAFMNCGMDSGSWNPPNVQLSDIVYMDLRQAISDPNSPFGACAALIDAFESAAQQTGLPSILLASLAMQESSCNPGATGGAGEIGLMQITPDKCQGDCYDAATNLGIGARYFKTVLDSHNGNLFQTTGEYNGWYPGMNPGDVLGNPCPQQQNLDYLHHMYNHWMQNRDPNGAGTERNKEACGGY